MNDEIKPDFDPVPLGNLANRNFAELAALLPPKPATPVEPRPLPALDLVIDNKPVVKPVIEVKPPEPLPVESKPPTPSKVAWVPEALKALVKPTRTKGVMAAGVASLAAGIYGTQWLWPSKPAPHVEPVAKSEPAPLPPPQVVVEPAVVKLEEPLKIAIPPAKLDESVKLAAAPMDPVVPKVEPMVPKIEPIVPKVEPIVPRVEPVAPKLDLPKIDPVVPKVEVTPPAPKLEPVVPKIEPIVPKVEPIVPKVEVTPPAPKLEPVVPKIEPVMPKVEPIVPKIEPIVPKVEVTPPVPKLDPVVPKIEPVLPKVEPMTPPKVEIAPPVVSVDTPKTIDLKPVPKDDFTPKTIEPVKATSLALQTDYDVDVHYAGSGDNWSSIAKQHLGDDRYADALREYNRGRVIAANTAIDVPPIHVLRKQFGGMIPQVKAVSETKSVAASGVKYFEVPQGGMSLKDIARKAWGDENYWGQVWEMNPKLRADEPVAAGTKVKLPLDAKIGQ